MSSSPVVTLTLNPTLDVSWSVDTVAPADKLRATPERAEPGGGGVNVSRVCQRLGQATTAVVTLGGPVGQQVADRIDPAVLLAVPIQGETRQSITVAERSSGAQYRFVLPGPTLAPAELQAAIEAVADAAGQTGLVVVSGSMPPGVEGGFLANLANTLGPGRLIIDTSGPALADALAAGAHLVKPSAKELANLVGRELETEVEVMEAADEILAASEAAILLASIGAGGAYLTSKHGDRFRLRAPGVKVASAVGAGDSMVAGLAVALQCGLPLEQVAAYAVAAGTAAVMTAGTELCHPADIDRLLPLVNVEPR